MSTIVSLQKALLDKSELVFLKDGMQVALEEGDTWSYLDKSYLLQEPSGYKDYNLISILYFYQNRQIDHTNYLHKCAAQSITPVGFMDRNDLLDYLKGGQSQHIANNLFGFDLAEKQKLLQPAVLQDVAEMSRINQLTRTINNRTSILCCPKKDFTNIQHVSKKLLIDQPVKRPQSQPQSHSKSKKKDYCIILVPSGAQSLISLYNVEDFLKNDKFVPPQSYREKGIHKPTKVEFKKNDIHWIVYDSYESMSKSDWERVKVVFTNGQEWQFKGWKWDKPVDIFHRVTGFYLKYQDEPVPGQCSQWKVNQLNVHRIKRNLDAAEAYKFWKIVSGK